MSQRPNVIHSKPEILGGTPVFFGTRVPAQTLFDYLEGGEPLDEFLRQFPDENLPADLAAGLAGHQPSTVAAEGWEGITNGELLQWSRRRRCRRLISTTLGSAPRM